MKQEKKWHEMSIRIAILIMGLLFLWVLVKMEAHHNERQELEATKAKHKELREKYSPMTETKEVQEAYDELTNTSNQ